VIAAAWRNRMKSLLLTIAKQKRGRQIGELKKIEMLVI
jgi:hypothetical protein